MSAYLSAVIADTPVHYWRCADQGGGVLNDIGSSMRPLHAASGQFEPLGYSGPNSDGGAIDLELQSFWVTSLDTLPTPSFPLSMEALVWIFGAAKTVQLAIWDTAPQIALQRTVGDQLEFIYNNTAIIAAGTVSHRAWHHLVGTYDGTNARVYVDGSLGNTVAVASQPASNSVVSFGANITQSDFSNIMLSEVAFYNTALSGARVAAHFAAIDQLANFPVFGGAGGLGGSGSSVSSPAYLGILQQILQSVRKLY